MSYLNEKISVGIAGNMYSSAGHEMLMDINGTPLSATDDKEFRPEVQYNDYCIEVSHREDYILYTYLANPVTVHSYGASRPGSLWIALTVPKNTVISGSNPFDLLMEILNTFRKEYMNLRADGSYEFKEINCVSTPIRSILDKYQLLPYRRYVPMRGVSDAFVKTGSKEKMRDFLRDTQYDEFKDYATIIAAENVNGNYLNIDIPRQRNYEVYVNGNRQSDTIGAHNGIFDKTFQEDYRYPIRVDFSIPELLENNGQKTIHADNGFYEVRLDEILERVDVKVDPRELAYSHDILLLDNRLCADEIQVTLDNREHKIETGRDGLIVKLIGNDEKKAGSLRFSHSRYELDVHMDIHGVYSVRVKSVKFQGTKCIIYGDEKDNVTIYDRCHEYEGGNRQAEMLFSGVPAKNIKTAESDKRYITYHRVVLTNEEGWDRIGFYQVIQRSQPITTNPAAPASIDKIPLEDNVEKRGSEIGGRVIVISKDRRLEDLSIIYVECVFDSRRPEDALADMFRIKRRFEGQENITIRIPDIYEGKDIYKVIVYKDTNHSCEFVIEDSLEVRLDIDSFSYVRTGKKKLLSGIFSCKIFRKLLFGLLAVIIVAAGVYLALPNMFVNKNIKKFTAECVLPIEGKIAEASEMLEKQHLSISEMESVLELCDEADKLLETAKSGITSSDLSKKQIKKQEIKLKDTELLVESQVKRIEEMLKADAARYRQLMINLIIEDTGEELTFEMTCDIKKWVEYIKDSRFLCELMDDDDNMEFVGKYIGSFVAAVDEINSVKDGKGIVKKGNSKGSKYVDLGTNNRLTTYSFDTNLRELANKGRDFLPGNVFEPIRISLQKLYLKIDNDNAENELRESLIEQTILTERKNGCSDYKLMYVSINQDTIYIDSFNGLRNFTIPK